MNAWIKMLAAALLFAAWGALVLLGKADAHEYVFALGQALVGLGVYHATTNGTAPAGQLAAGAAQPAGAAARAEPALNAPAAAAPAPVVAQPAPVPNAAAPAAMQ